MVDEEQPPPWSVVLDKDGLAWQLVGGVPVGSDGEYHWEASLYKGGLGWDALGERRGPLRVVHRPGDGDRTPETPRRRG